MADLWKRQLGWTALTVAVLVTLCHLTGARGQCTVSTVNTISGNGNTADTDGYITFSPLPTKSFKSTGEYDDGGLGPFFNLGRSFINSSLPNPLPVGIISGLLDGSFNIMTDYTKIITLSLGYLICIVIGIVFMVVFPIIGMCFCCCRCCGNCGGKRVQNPANNNNCKRMTYAGIFGLLVLFISVGVICLFVTNGRMTVAINNFETVFDDSITDADNYIQLLKEQIQHLGADNYNFTGEVIIRDLRGMDAIFGAPVVALLHQNANLTVVIDSVTALQSTIDSLSSTLNSIESGVTDVDNNVTALNNSLSTVKGNIQNTFTSCNCGGNIDLNKLDSNYNIASFPSVSSQVSAIDSAKQSNINSSLESALTELNDLPCKLKNESQSTVDDVVSAIQDFGSGQLNQLTSQVDTLSSGFNVSSYSGSIDLYIGYAKQYDSYRSYAGMGLAGLVLLITVLMLFGLILGICCSSVDDPPTKRSCLSNSGGNMLIASVILIFIFSWLFMLLTTLTYTLGAPVERWVCQPAMDFNSPLYTQFLDKPGGPLGEGYFIGKTLYGNSSIDITVSGILRDCRDGKSAYNALRLNNFFDIDTVLDYGNYIDFTSNLSSLQSHLTLSVNIMTPEMEKNLQNVKDAVDVDTNSFITELDRNLTDVNLTAFAQSLRDLGDEVVANATAPTQASAQATRTELYDHASSLDNITANELQNLQTSVNSLKTDVRKLDNEKNQVVVDVDNLNSSLRNTEDFLNNGVTPLLSEETDKYVNRLTRTLDAFINYTLDAVKNDMGKCDIVYNLFADMFTIGVCRYTLDAFNAIWLALGWCIFFFTVSIVFAVKLSKHFRRMYYLDGRYLEETKESARLIPSVESIVIRPVDEDYDETKESAKLLPESMVIKPVVHIHLHVDETKRSAKLLPPDESIPVDVDLRVDETRESAKLLPADESVPVDMVEVDLGETKENGKLLPTDGLAPVDVDLQKTKENGKLLPTKDSTVVKSVEIDADEGKESDKLLPSDESAVVKPVDVDLHVDETKESGKFLPTDDSAVNKPVDDPDKTKICAKRLPTEDLTLIQPVHVSAGGASSKVFPSTPADNLPTEDHNKVAHMDGF